jgi:type I restriction enzyme M protein
MLGTHPSAKLTAEEHVKNNLPDVLARWHKRESTERDRARTEQSFAVKREEIEAAGYDLSLNRYKEVVHEHVEHVAPLQLIAELNAIEAEIQAGLKQLEGMLK